MDKIGYKCDLTRRFQQQQEKLEPQAQKQRRIQTEVDDNNDNFDLINDIQFYKRVLQPNNAQNSHFSSSFNQRNTPNINQRVSNQDQKTLSYIDTENKISQQKDPKMASTSQQSKSLRRNDQKSSKAPILSNITTEINNYIPEKHYQQNSSKFKQNQKSCAFDPRPEPTKHYSRLNTQNDEPCLQPQPKKPKNNYFDVQQQKQRISSNSIEKTAKLKVQNSLKNHFQVQENFTLTILEQPIGSGSFGVVYKAKINENQQTVAIKKVLQDKRYKNRELQILQHLNHPNVIKLIHHFYSNGEKNNPDETYLNAVFPYFTENLYEYRKSFTKRGQDMPSILIKFQAYQLLRSNLYIHSMQICHRDIKPHNILYDQSQNRLILCDFGSAKKLVKTETNISYICSRCYRAPELIFAATQYTTQIDIWSSACVIAELINGEPLFAGDSAVDQLVEIIKVIGTPSKQDVMEMNPEYDLKSFNFPFIKPRDWKKILKHNQDPLTIDFVSKLLVYSPIKRLSAVKALAHPYFDELRDFKRISYLRSQIKIPDFFNFNEEELSVIKDLEKRLVPDWYKENAQIFSQN